MFYIKKIPSQSLGGDDIFLRYGLFEAEEFDFENEGGTSRNNTACTLVAVCELGRDVENELGAGY